ncbi:tryptophan halogenase family protein [Agarilytica rhodophyticola]|uniref:tryptophan halogenase family protein n=1 Tax=Agarilytica rhodophyticola TaxID=1737490 RepID=UPI000B349D90|nr:tryptophan halogenase family protein [Agarilytica rhodophyticola]
MHENRVKRIVIVGGGTAGWMTAAALTRLFGQEYCAIELLESDQIGTVGVGEATLPHLRYFIQTLGLNEHEFMRATNASYKTGIEFINWGRIGEFYIHPFGEFGQSINGIDFHHYWLKLRQLGDDTSIGDYSLPVVASKYGRFDYPSSDPRSILSTYSYAFHLDAHLFARYLRTYCETRGLVRKEGKVKEVYLRQSDGFISAVRLDNGQHIEGDLFIDCTGFNGLLIEQHLKTGYIDWRHWLPCDRAIAMATKSQGELLPYTKAIAHEAGWQWRIPLQHRTGNGHIYSSSFMSDQQAESILRDNLDGQVITEANYLRFTTGMRKQFWNKNCIAIGLAAGFLEPLESTSIHLIQLAIMKLIEFFPDKRCDSVLRDEYNRMMTLEFERLRDFLVLHYCATERDDTEFWRYCKNMSKPDGLDHKINLFRKTGYVSPYTEGLFLKASWLAVYLGQGIVPENYDPRVEDFDLEKLANYLASMQTHIAQAAQSLPAHAKSIAKHCATENHGSYQPPPATLNLYGRR